MANISELHPATIGTLARDFATSGSGMIRLTEFLEPGTAHRIADTASKGPGYEHVYCLTPPDGTLGRGRHTDRETWLAAPEESRYFHFETSREWTYAPGQNAVDDECPLTVSELSEVFDFVSGVTGQALSSTRVELHRMAAGDFVGRHRDLQFGRRFAGHLYLSPWRPEDGGLLRMHGFSGEILDLPPEYNSFTLFDVKGHDVHEVTEVRGPVPRVSLNFWFF